MNLKKIFLILSTLWIGSCQTEARRPVQKKLFTPAIAASSPSPDAAVAPGESTASQLPPASNQAFEVVRFGVNKKHFLQGFLFRPAKSGSYPAIVAMHGCGGMFTKDGTLNPRELDWGQRLAQKGYVVLYPDSFTSRGIQQICTRAVSFPGMARRVRPHDAFAALHWLQQQSYVDKDRVALMGWSHGAISVLNTMGEKFEHAAEKSEGDFKVAIAFYPDCEPFLKLPKWETRAPIEILMGELDTWTPPDRCRRFVAMPEHTSKVHLTVYPESHHDFDSPDLPRSVINNLTSVESGDHSAIVETNPKTRAQAIQKVFEILDHQL